MYPTYRYRLRPTKTQRLALLAILERVRRLYNEALSLKKHAWEVYRKSVSLFDTFRWIARQAPDLPANLKRAAMKQLDFAYQTFFRKKLGFPRFKSENRFDSFGFAAFDGITLKRGRLFFCKGVRGGIDVRFHRPLPAGAKICSCRFKRDHKGWSVSFHLKMPTPGKVEVRSAVGVDVGLTHFVALSNGEFFENPRVGKTHEKRLRIASRALARCRHGSNRRKKIKVGLVRAHAVTGNARSTWLHRLARQLTTRFDLIAVERLAVAGMARGRLAKSIYDASWGKLLSMIAYKAEGAGKTVIEVDPRGTSQVCSRCGKEVPKKLSERTHRCPHCGLVLDRDTNAARNILHRAVASPEPLNVARRRKRAAGTSMEIPSGEIS